MTAALPALARDALCRVLGERARELAPPEQLAGAELVLALEPASAAELAAVLAALHEHALPALVTGGGSRLDQGNPARAARVRLDCRGLRGIREFDAADGVARVGAGTPLAELAPELRAAGWQLGLDPPGEDSTLGGALASAAAGPRGLAFGPARDCVLGLDVVLASGERTKCGGRVVKNVTGYDLAKLYVGSFGSLGVIESAWLHLRPLPQQVATLGATLGAGAFESAIAAARRPSARAVALASPELAAQIGAPEPAASDAWSLVCELAGDSSVCRQDERWLADSFAARVLEPAVLAAMREQQGHAAPESLRARLHLLPSALESCCSALRRAGARLLAYPLPGLVYAWLAPPAAGSSPSQAWLDEALGVLEAARAQAGGQLVLESLPTASHSGSRAEIDVFGGGGEALPLMRALKQRFDPRGILNPGRFVAGI